METRRDQGERRCQMSRRKRVGLAKWREAPCGEVLRPLGYVLLCPICDGPAGQIALRKSIEEDENG